MFILTDKLVQNFNINNSFLNEFSDSEIESILKIAKEIENANPVDINMKKWQV